MTRADTFLPGDPVCDALFSGARARGAQNRAFVEGPIEFLPGHFSNTWEDMVCKQRIAVAATKAYPPSVDDLGRVSGNGIRSNFYGLQHVNGFGQLPATFPLADNRKLREDAGLANHFVEDWHRVALRAIVKLFFSSLEPTALRLRKGSSSMAPFYETRMPKKKEIAAHALRTGRVSAEMMMKGDYETPWIQNQCGGAYHTVYRRQSSDVITYENSTWIPKVRMVADLEYALTGGASGNWFASSKELGDVGFKVPPGFFRERKRTAMGGPLGMNAVLMPIAQPVRNHIYKEYAFTFHHTTRENIQNDLRAWKMVIPADVTQHDQFWPTFILGEIAEGMLESGLQEWWITLYLVKARLPLYVTDVGPGLGNILIGDWRKPDLHVGLPSGNAFTDLEGTILMTWVYFLIQVEHTYRQLIPQLRKPESAIRLLDLYMKGKLPITLKDKSDDALLGWTDVTLVPAATALLERMKAAQDEKDATKKAALVRAISPYMVVSYEHGGAFLGSVLLYPESKDISKLVLIGNGISLLVNQFSPEYGVQSGVKDRSRVRRPFPGLAWDSLPAVYGSSPAFGGLMEIIEREWYDVHGESYRGYREKLLRQDQQRLLDYVHSLSIDMDVSSLSMADKEVLADSDKAQYKYTPDQLAPGVADLLFQGLPVEEVEPFFRSAYHG